MRVYCATAQCFKFAFVLCCFEDLNPELPWYIAQLVEVLASTTECHGFKSHPGQLPAM